MTINNKIVKKFRFRWDDIDANRHVANTSYTKVTVNLRMEYLEAHGFGQSYFEDNQLGPVSLNEELHFISEVDGNEQLYVDFQIDGLSRDNKFFKFAHHIYDSDGLITFYTTTLIAFLDLRKRKLITAPLEFTELIEQIPRTAHFHELTKKDLRKAYVPYNLKLNLEGLV